MKKMQIGSILCVLLIFNVAFANSKDSSFKAKYSDEKSIIEELKKGGHVIFLRHHLSRKDQVDSDRKNLENCKTQRNLTEEGKNGSKEIGEAFKKLGINVSKVLSSPYCRCVDTAQIAFGQVQIHQDLHFAVDVDEKERARRAQALMTMLQTPPDKNSNTVIVSHTANLKEATGIWPKIEGVIYVFRPEKNKSFELVGKINPNTWKNYL